VLAWASSVSLPQHKSNVEKACCLLSTLILGCLAAWRSPKVHWTAKDGLEKHFKYVWSNMRFSCHTAALREVEACFWEW